MKYVYCFSKDIIGHNPRLDIQNFLIPWLLRKIRVPSHNGLQRTDLDSSPPPKVKLIRQQSITNASAITKENSFGFDNSYVLPMYKKQNLLLLVFFLSPFFPKNPQWGKNWRLEFLCVFNLMVEKQVTYFLFSDW